MMKLNGQTKAFTLIELLVVVAIIGILAAVGVVAYNGYTASAKRNATLQQHAQAVKFINNTLKLCDVQGGGILKLSDSRIFSLSFVMMAKIPPTEIIRPKIWNLFVFSILNKKQSRIIIAGIAALKRDALITWVWTKDKYCLLYTSDAADEL